MLHHVGVSPQLLRGPLFKAEALNIGGGKSFVLSTQILQTLVP